jgi:hypothetical protein
MGRIRHVSACIAAILLALSSQEMMAQGSLLMKPQPVDDMMSPYPLGPLQKFGNVSPGSEAGFLKFQQAPPPLPRQVHVVRNGQFQTQRRPSLISEPRRIALRSPARQHEWQRGVAGSRSALALAPTNQERLPSRQFCFPSSTIHFLQNERDDCNIRAPAYKGRFEELLEK